MDRKAFIEKLVGRIRQWENEIDKLEAKAQEAEAELKVEYGRQIEELRSQKKAMEEKLEKLEQAGDAAWQELKGSLETALNNMDNALRSALEKFK